MKSKRAKNQKPNYYDSSTPEESDYSSQDDTEVKPKKQVKTNKKSNKATTEIEKTYQKKTQLEHILLRPDSYIGTIEHITDKLWVYDSKKDTLVYRTISYVPGLYKIFDEILVNAIDNITRDKSMNTIKVEISDSSISVYNNGKGIPVAIHKAYNIYVPELIFGHLLTSSNYDDQIKKITGGRNGYGAKWTNIFSQKFIIETADKKNKKSFRMEFANNMTKHSDPEINSKYDGEDFTKITFEPDFKKFKMSGFDEDIIALIKKRVYDCAGTTAERVKVYLNNKELKINKFDEYIDLYLKGKYFDEEHKVEFQKMTAASNERWDVAFTMSDASFQQVSFVNGICTTKGGTHVNYIIDQVTDRISELIKKKNKDIKMNTNQIKQNLWVFINCSIENPSFDSQTKETLTTWDDKFGSKCVLTEKFIKEFLKSSIVSNIIDFAKAKQRVKLHKALSSNIKKATRWWGIDKWEDANLAGTKDFEQCTLIVTEGDSAKALAMAGIEVVGRDKYGVFPLRGKVLNVRGANDAQIMKNEEIQNIIKILGLKMNMDYSEELKGMRYGHLLIMADQDYDGSHIKGWIINFIHYFWPSLLKRGDFLQEFITPIVKASKDNLPSKVFFTVKEYTDWYNTNSHYGYKIKYYKGLGTSSAQEAKDYFMNIKKNKIDFFYVNKEDDECIELAFAKEKAEARKQWLLGWDQFNTYIDHSKGIVRYTDFINKELIFFSNYDWIRSIPSWMDGLKPSERKIWYACFKRNLKTELKVAQLAGYVAEHSSYHHGEFSLCGAITALAQDFVGTNNLNLILPIGQFGNRYNGIKGAASARYIYTALNPLTRKVFHESDDTWLWYNVDEGMKIEPVWYAPIIPMVLINGAQGIGTGWSTSIPQYNPIELAENLIKLINGESITELTPWYKGFIGDITEIENKGWKTFAVSGKISLLNSEENENSVEITELPIHTWTREYKTFLEKFYVDNKETKNDQREFEIEDIREYHSDNKISFIIRLTKDSFSRIKDSSTEDLIKLFKLSCSINTSNMVLFDSSNKIKKYNTIEEIIKEFYEVRLTLYEKRKEYLLAKIGFALEKNENKIKFINMVLSNEIPFKSSKSKNELLGILKTKGWLSMQEWNKKYQKAFQVNSTEIIVENEDEVKHEDKQDNYDYLMNMNIWSLTPDKVHELKQAIDNQKQEFNYLKKNDAKDLWRDDLNVFIDLYKQIWNQLNCESKDVYNKISKMKSMSLANKRKRTKKGKGCQKKKKTEDSFCEEDESDESISDNSNEFSEYSDENEDSGNKRNKKVTKGRVVNNIKKQSEKKKGKNQIKNDIDWEENEGVNQKKQSSAKKVKESGKKKSNIINDEEDEVNIDIDQKATSLLSALKVNKNYAPPSNVDISKWSWKERWALRAKQGRIDEYYQALNKKDVGTAVKEPTKTPSKKDETPLKFWQAKKKPEQTPPKKKPSTGKKRKKKKESSDEDDDEDYLE